MVQYLFPILMFFTFAPFIFGLATWIYGRKKNLRNLRHSGFIIMMITLLLIGIFVFTVSASFFYVWLISN